MRWGIRIRLNRHVVDFSFGARRHPDAKRCEWDWNESRAYPVEYGLGLAITREWVA